MKGRMLQLVTASAFALVSEANAASCAGSTCSGQIATLYVQAAGDIYVGMVGGISGLTNGCTPVSSAYATLLASSPNAKFMYATLLSAQFAGRSVTLRFSDGSTGCTIQYVTSP